MRESTIESAVCTYAKSKGCLVMKLSGPNQKGQPDRLFIYRGHMLFVEFKAPGKLPTTLQLRWLETLREHGMFATWCDDIERGKRMIDALIEIAGINRTWAVDMREANC